MKFIVDKLPKSSEECLFAERHFNPPFIREPEYYLCKRCGKECNLTTGKTECYLLKEGKYE